MQCHLVSRLKHCIVSAPWSTCTKYHNPEMEQWILLYFRWSLKKKSLTLPWHFGDFQNFPWLFDNFPSFPWPKINSLTFGKNHFPLTFPWPLATLLVTVAFSQSSMKVSASIRLHKPSWKIVEFAIVTRITLQLVVYKYPSTLIVSEIWSTTFTEIKRWHHLWMQCHLVFRLKHCIISAPRSTCIKYQVSSFNSIWNMVDLRLWHLDDATSGDGATWCPN